MSGFVYILKSRVNSRYYIGSTDNISRRLDEHNSGKAKYTKLTRPFDLMFSQEFPTLQKARKVEYHLKRLKSRQIIEKIIEDGKIRLADT